jgi:Fe-Mn family superoxide dismutase
MFELPQLPYAYDALEPHIDARTMEIHHSKHHAGYTNKLNTAIEATDLADKTIEEILQSENLTDAVRNNGGGFYNHDLFWKVMSPNGGGEPTGELADAIKKNFGSFEKFKEEFSQAAVSQFGSGWAWLAKSGDDLVIYTTANQDNPLMADLEVTGTPIMGIDVWEHAYYLGYQNKRPDYVAAFWNVVNWDEVARRYESA